MKIYTFDPKKHRIVLCGNLVEDTLFRDVKPEHFMKVDGYGIQEWSFQKIVKEGAKKIVLKEHLGNQWEARTKDWIEHGKVADYGHGKQRFLSLNYMKRHELKEANTK